MILDCDPQAVMVLFKRVKLVFFLISVTFFLNLESCFALDTPWRNETLTCVEVEEKYNRREHFGSWIDEDQDGLNTREEVLERENFQGTVIEKEKGKILIGKWQCPYTGQIFTQANRIHIDHMIPLKEAWDSGACRWSDEKRISFANHLDPRHLLAVYSRANQSKGSRDPSGWVPDQEVAQYISNWIDLKIRWNLTADPKEYRYIKSNENFLGKELPREFKLTTCFCRE